MQRISLFILLLFPFVCFAQESSKKKVSLRRQNIIIMSQQITNLREGALLVRLHTKTNTANFLRKIGKDEMAERIESEQHEENQNIVIGFRKNFNFCPVYFFYENYTSALRKKQIDSIVFVNDMLMPDSSIRLNEKKFLVAEFYELQKDTAKYYDRDYLYDGFRKRRGYWGGPDMQLKALIVRSDEFVQLKRPFPYYVRTYDDLFKRSPQKAVMILNKKLNKFFIEYRISR
jgi:hypothetical protein